MRIQHAHLEHRSCPALDLLRNQHMNLKVILEAVLSQRKALLSLHGGVMFSGFVLHTCASKHLRRQFQLYRVRDLMTPRNLQPHRGKPTP